MMPRERKLTAALLANASLRDQAELLIAAYVAPDSNRPAIINGNDYPLRRPAAARGEDSRQRRWTRGAHRKPAEGLLARG
jgi:hypothetical protein